MVSLTEKAAFEVKRLIDKDAGVNPLLRLAVIGGGCSGMSYKLSFEKETGTADQTFENYGIKILVDSKSLMFVDGITVDFSDGLEGTGFNFINPKAKKSCGCGSSFSA